MSDKSLALWPTSGPFRWLPRQGKPTCIGECLAQRVIKGLAWLPVYTAVVVTLCLLVLVLTR